MRKLKWLAKGHAPKQGGSQLTQPHLPALNWGALARPHLLPMACGARKQAGSKLRFLPPQVLSMLSAYMDCGLRFRSCWKVFLLPSRNTELSYSLKSVHPSPEGLLSNSLTGHSIFPRLAAAGFKNIIYNTQESFCVSPSQRKISSTAVFSCEIPNILTPAVNWWARKCWKPLIWDEFVFPRCISPHFSCFSLMVEFVPVEPSRSRFLWEPSAPALVGSHPPPDDSI